MAYFVERLWESQFAGIGLSRRDRRSGPYRAYVPDRLAGRPFTFEPEVAAEVADAERAIARLDATSTALANTEALARLLLRAEAVASSHIEGLQVSPQRLLKADVARNSGLRSDPMAIEVLANVDAMAYAVEGPEHDVTVPRLLEVHRRLLAPTSQSSEAGRIRTQQNWIGGTIYTPFGSAFIPPPPEMVPDLLDDLCGFCNAHDFPAVAQAAIAHAQFETIHPFIDGNGRTGRALIYMVFKRRGLATKTLPPVSLVLATRANDYVTALQATRYDGAPNSTEAIKSNSDWIALFASACVQAVRDVESFEARVEQLHHEWKRRLGTVRSDAAAVKLIDHLPAMPILTADTAAKGLDIAFSTATAAIDALIKAGILTQTTAGKRNRAFEARELVDAFTSLERQLASPDGNTRISQPARAIPYRPSR